MIGLQQVLGTGTARKISTVVSGRLYQVSRVQILDGFPGPVSFVFVASPFDQVFRHTPFELVADDLLYDIFVLVALALL